MFIERIENIVRFFGNEVRNNDSENKRENIKIVKQKCAVKLANDRTGIYSEFKEKWRSEKKASDV